MLKNKEAKLKIIDCTHPLNNESSYYPGDSPLRITSVKNYKQDGFSLSEINTSMHVGTHIDAPSHLTSLEVTMDEFSLEQGITQGIVFNVVGQDVIELDNQQLEQVQKNDSVILYTGWDKFYGDKQYYSHPYVSIDTARKLIDKGISMLIMDMPSPDYHPFLVHKLFMEHGVWLVENATNLQQLNPSKAYQVFAIPIKIKAEAALARLFAIEID